MGWPKFVLDQNDLRYVGHLPRDVHVLLSTHLWWVTIQTNIFSHLFLLPLGHYFGNVFGRLKLKRNYSSGMESRQITSLHHHNVLPLHLELTLVNDCSASGSHGV